MTARQLRQYFLLVTAALVGFGCVAVYSATAVMGYQNTGSTLSFFWKHLAAVAIGAAAAIGCLACAPASLRRSAKWLVGVSLVSLVLVRLLAPEIGGAHRWFRFGPLSIQPSEFAQLALVVYLADYLARKGAVLQDFTHGFLPPMLVAGAMTVLLLAQPDLGSSVVLWVTAILMLAVAKAKPKHLGGLMACGSIGVIALIFGEAYRRRRLLAFLNPWQDPQGAGFQILQSYVAMANGGLAGQGLGDSMQKLFFLPGAHTDFIFAIIGEELGLIGVTLVMALFVLFVTSGLRMAQSAEDPFCTFLILGCTTLIALKALVNMAVVTGLLPTKGLPLPFISYGGTSVVANLIACGLMLMAHRHGASTAALDQAVSIHRQPAGAVA